jgi:hypothetical protein
MRYFLQSDRPDRFVRVVQLLRRFKSHKWNLKHTDAEWLLPLCSDGAVDAAKGAAAAAETPLAAAHAVWACIVEQGSWVEPHALVPYSRALAVLEPDNGPRRAGVAAVHDIVKNTFPNNNVKVRTHAPSHPPLL